MDSQSVVRSDDRACDVFYHTSFMVGYAVVGLETGVFTGDRCVCLRWRCAGGLLKVLWSLFFYINTF